MDIKNGKIVIKSLLERYNFSSLYFENGFSWECGLSNFYGEPHSATDFLLASAITGNKVAGFFKKLPFFRVERLIRGECVFVSENIPIKIKWPTIFCKKPEDFGIRFALALKVSRESNLPVALIVSQNAINGFSNFTNPEIDLTRTSPYISPATLESYISPNILSEHLGIAENILKTELPQKAFDKYEISFEGSLLGFFDYLMPKKPNEAVLSLVDKKVSVPEGEAEFLNRFVKENYGINLEVEPIKTEILYETKEFLCPGCPFVNIFIKSSMEKKIVFTNVACDGLFKTFKLINITFDAYIGLLSKGLNGDTVFIGGVSSYKPYYNEFINNGCVIFLNDCGINNIGICSSIRHPKKFPKDKKNILYPYSCFNIKKYSRLKIKAKKCKCIEQEEICPAMERTKCPALFVTEGKVQIDSALCSGCYACVSLCKFGAIV